MRTVLHLVAMPWSHPQLPSPQLAALKAYVDAALGDSLRSATFSAFLDIVIDERHGRVRNYHREFGEFGEYIYFLICYRRFLRKDGHFRRISFDRLLFSLNRSMPADQSHVTRKLLGTLERKTRRYVDKVLTKSLRKRALNVVGFTLSSVQLYASIYCARYLQERYPEFRCLFVFGGEMVNLPKVKAVLKHFEIRGLAVVGEGEKKLEMILRTCMAMPTAEVDSIISELASTIVGTYDIQSDAVNLYEFDTGMLRNQVARMEDLPLPSFDEYFASVRRSLRVRHLRSEFSADISLALEGSRGCCYGKCDFCDIKRSWNGFRTASAEWIADRVFMLTSKHRCRRIQFVDCSCDAWAGRYAEILIDAGIKIGGLMELRASHPQQFWTKLSLAGIDHIQIGVEALAPRLLAAMNKGTTVSQNVRVLKWLKELGIESWSNIITHHPKSTLEDIKVTKQILPQIAHFDRLDIANFALMMSSPIDETLIAEERRQLVERHACTWPKSVSPYLVRYSQFELPARLEDGAVMCAWDEFVSWEQNRFDRYGKRAAMTQTRCEPRQLVIVDSRWGEPREYFLKGDSAIVYDACHQGRTLDELRQATRFTETLIRRELDQLLKAKLLLEVDGGFLALALRPRDELVCSYFGTGSLKESSVRHAG
jgi:Radical SAM superfamily